MALDTYGHGNLGYKESKYDKLKRNINKIVLYKTANGISEKMLYGITQNSVLIGDISIDNLLTEDIKKSMFWVDIDFVISQHFNSQAMKYVNILPPTFSNWIQLLNYCNNCNESDNLEIGLFRMQIGNDTYEFDLITIKANCFDYLTKDLHSKEELAILYAKMIMIGLGKHAATLSNIICKFIQIKK